MTVLYAGIDIASKTFQAHWQHVGTGEVGEREFQQCNSHYQTFIKRLKSLCEAEHIHVVMEATGNYWLYLTRIMLKRVAVDGQEASFPVHQLQ